MQEDSVLSCFLEFDKKNTKEGAIEFLKCLSRYYIVVYWSSTWKRLIIKPKVGYLTITKGLRKRYTENVRKLLRIKSKHDLDEVKQRYSI